MKRKPKVYLSHHFENSTLNVILEQIEYTEFPGEVIILDPARHGLNTELDPEEIVNRNLYDLHDADLVCLFFDSKVTAGVALELSIAVSTLGKESLVFTNVPLQKMNPYVQKLSSGKTRSFYSVIDVLANWVKGWYERS